MENRPETIEKQQVQPVVQARSSRFREVIGSRLSSLGWLRELSLWLVVLGLYLFAVGHIQGSDPSKPQKMNLMKLCLVTGITAWGLALASAMCRLVWSERNLVRAFSVVAVLCLLMMRRSVNISHVVEWEIVSAIRHIVLGCALVVAVAYGVRAIPRWGSRASMVALVSVIVALIVGRGLVLLVSPEPRIDVFTLAREASAAFWRGENPYAAEYGNLYAGTTLDLGYSPGYNYFPLTLLFNVLSDRWFGDVRAGFVFAEALSAAAVVLFVHALGWSWRIGLLLGVIWCANGLSFQIVEKWNDSLALALLLATLAALAGRRWSLAGICLGLAVATKQYVPLAVLPIGLWLWKTEERAPQRRFAVAFVATTGLLYLPFLLNQGDWFVHRTLLHFGRTPFREDSISLLNAARTLLGFSPEGSIVRVAPYIGLLIGLGSATALVLCSSRSSTPADRSTNMRWLVIALVCVWAGFFHFIKQSFLNYYYFLFGVCSLLLIVTVKRADTRSDGHG